MPVHCSLLGCSVPRRARAQTSEHEHPDRDDHTSELSPRFLVDGLPGNFESVEATGLRITVLCCFHKTPLLGLRIKFQVAQPPCSSRSFALLSLAYKRKGRSPVVRLTRERPQKNPQLHINTMSVRLPSYLVYGRCGKCLGVTNCVGV